MLVNSNNKCQIYSYNEKSRIAQGITVHLEHSTRRGMLAAAGPKEGGTERTSSGNVASTHRVMFSLPVTARKHKMQGGGDSSTARSIRSHRKAQSRAVELVARIVPALTLTGTLISRFPRTGEQVSF